MLGKFKEAYWRDAENEYLKRLQAFAKVNIIELKEESFSEKDNPEKIKQKEKIKIEDEIKKIGETFLIALEEKGKTYSSPDFSKRMITWSESISLTFVIGGPLGLHPDLVKEANAIISLSPLTFTHQMARVILLEQIYRAFMIAENRRYHY